MSYRWIPVVCLFVVAVPALSQSAPLSQPALKRNYGRLALSFEANRGQADEGVRFTSRGDGYRLMLTGREAVLALNKAEKAEGLASGARPHRTVSGEAIAADEVRMQLKDARPEVAVMGEERLPGTVNYFLGSDPAKWQTGVPTYAKVRYAGVYPGVDLVYYGNQRELEYDFVVAPGADARRVKLDFAGVERLRIAASGDLMVTAKNGEITFHKPVVYQWVGEEGGERKRRAVDGRFVLLAGNTVGFAMGHYDRSRELVIDPVLSYSTYLGAAGSDYASAIAVDASGNAYITGYTYSQEFPTTSGAYQKTSSYTASTSTSAVFVTKINASGTALVYSTYLAGTATHCTAGTNYNALTQGDFGTGIAVNSGGDAYVAGGTCANDFPTTKGAFQTTAAGTSHHAPNGFGTKLDASGSGLVYSTYLGGGGANYSGDWVNAIRDRRLGQHLSDGADVVD